MVINKIPRVLYIFLPDKLLCQLLQISPTNVAFLKIFNSKFSYMEVSFTEKNSKPLEIEDKMNLP